MSVFLRQLTMVARFTNGSDQTLTDAYCSVQGALTQFWRPPPVVVFPVLAPLVDTASRGRDAIRAVVVGVGRADGPRIENLNAGVGVTARVVRCDGTGRIIRDYAFLRPSSQGARQATRVHLAQNDQRFERFE